MNSSVKVELFDEMIADSRQRLAGLKSEAELEEKYLHDLIRRRSELPGATINQNAEPVGPAADNGAVVPEGNQYITGHTVPEAVREVLEKHGKAMRARDVVLALTSAGFKTESKRGLLPGVLSALNRREDLFKKVRRGVYKLIATPQQNPEPTK